MTLLAFVTMAADGAAVSERTLASAWETLWPREKPLERPGSQSDDTLVFPFMGGLATVSHMPGPIPWSDLEGPASMAWHWPEATQVLRAHRTHQLVGLLHDDGPPIARAIKLTLLTAAVVAAAPAATGVYWPEGTTVLPADRFVRAAREMTPDSLPLLSWIEFRLFRGESTGTSSLFTTGMTALGHMEIEVQDSRLPPHELFERIYNVADYLTQAGPVLKDGDTVGSDEDERFLVRHSPSAWDREGPVLSISV